MDIKKASATILLHMIFRIQHNNLIFSRVSGVSFFSCVKCVSLPQLLSSLKIISWLQTSPAPLSELTFKSWWCEFPLNRCQVDICSKTLNYIKLSKCYILTCVFFLTIHKLLKSQKQRLRKQNVMLIICRIKELKDVSI